MEKPVSQTKLELDDFSNPVVAVMIKDGKHAGSTFEYSISQVSLVLNEQIDAHPEIVMSDDEASKAWGNEWDPNLTYYKRTTKFLKALSDGIAEFCEVYCDPMLADYLWQAVTDAEQVLKKSTDETPS